MENALLLALGVVSTVIVLLVAMILWQCRSMVNSVINDSVRGEIGEIKNAYNILRNGVVNDITLIDGRVKAIESSKLDSQQQDK